MMKNVFGFDEILDDHLRLAFLLGCFGHDLDHTGRNNAFEVQSGSKLAVRYHEDSPLENHHAATLFKIIGNLSGVKGKKCDGGYYGSRMECDLLKGFSAEERGRMKNFVIQVILATDMKIHFKLIGNFLDFYFGFFSLNLKLQNFFEFFFRNFKIAVLESYLIYFFSNFLVMKRGFVRFDGDGRKR